MIIIYAYINARPFYDEPDRIKLHAFCNEHGFKAPFYVYSIEGLEMLMEQNRDESVLLFSNFPPNSSYPEMTRNNYGKPWEADSYQRTGQHFSHWHSRYRFAAIHFVTGAPESVLSDEAVKGYLPNLKVSIIRKGIWIQENVDFEKVFTTYMIETIRKYC